MTPGSLTVAKMAGFSLPRAYEVAREREFPLPVKIAGRVKLYDGPAVRRWLADREKRKAKK
jgi:predicted DNA-binding transcriptional regulator AlpA